MTAYEHLPTDGPEVTAQRPETARLWRAINGAISAARGDGAVEVAAVVTLVSAAAEVAGRLEGTLDQLERQQKPRPPFYRSGIERGA